MRPLLPFERSLIAQLGIDEAEYHAFLAAQERNRIAYCQNPPEVVNGDPVSIVLAVVGLIFQVVALLLRPQPQRPETQQREQRFSPTFGFNSVQEVAKYGDPITLVYTNTDDNSKGGVRVNTSLVWSNVQSYGNGQYGQFLSVIGAGEIGSIRPLLTGIGQNLLSQQPQSRYWIYWKSGAGSDNRLVGGDLVQGSSIDPGFPAGTNNLVYAITPGGSATRTEGFSQAFSPTNANTFGVFAAFGVANLFTFVANGNPDRRTIGITPDNDTLTAWGANALFSVGTFVSIAINDTTNLSAVDADAAAQDIRRSAAQSIDAGSLYLFGSMILEFYDFLSSVVDTDDGTVIARFRVVRAGYAPSTPPNTDQDGAGNWINTKGICKIEVARYETLSKVSVVDFCLKARIFRRLNDTATPSKPRVGLKTRQAFFKLSYRKKTAQSLTRVPGYFVLQRSADIDSYSFLKFVAASPDVYVFEFEPVSDIPSDQALTGSSSIFYYIDQAASSGAANYRSVTVGSDKFFYVGTQTNALVNGNAGRDWDLFGYLSYFSQQFSSDSGPEVTIGVINEQQLDTRTDKSLYDGLSMLGVNIFSGRNLTDLRQISAFVDRGKKLRRLDPTATQAPFYPSVPDGASSYPPDIFLDTLLDSRDGIAELTDPEAIDLETLVESRRFCQANNIYFDGIFAQRTNWRQFWASNAPLLLHELTRINGREAIRPALPYDPATGNITRQIDISELYNESNILEDSYREEFLDFGDNTRDLEATLIYREFVDQSSPSVQPARNFPVNRTLVVTRADSDPADITRQQFDLSAFCTTRAQALLLGKFLCNLRRYQRRAVEFKTIPTLTSIAPGEYIYVQLGQITWDNAKTGVVGREGVLVSPAIGADFTELTNVLLYRSGEPVVRLNNLQVTNAQSSVLRLYEGYLFVLGSSLNTKRCFRVEEVQIDEDGVIAVRALEYPLDTEGLSLIAKLDDADYTIVG